MNLEEILREHLPPNGFVTERAQKELARFDLAAVATLVETFGRRCQDRHLPREDKPVPVGKGRVLAETRISYQGCEYRLIYMIVRPAGSSGAKSTRVVISARPIRFVGVLSVNKKGNKLGVHATTAWKRSETWLSENLGYERV
jgi:hypothetical protein